MTAFSYPRFINFWRKLYQKFEKLSLGKQLGIILITIIVIWQVVCFVQGAITARAMNYYCEKEAGIKLAEGTYFMQIPKDEYQDSCYKAQPNLPFYCRSGYDAKRQWIEIKGSLHTDLNLMPTKPQKSKNPDNEVIRFSMGGIVKETQNFKNINNIIVYKKINFSVNSDFLLIEALAYNLFRNGQSISLKPNGTVCHSSELHDDIKNQSDGLLVNRG